MVGLSTSAETISQPAQSAQDHLPLTNGQAGKKRLLFIPASIRSHIIPTLYVADQLADEYDIYYAVTNQVLADIITQNGYTPVFIDPFRVAYGMERGFLLAKKRKVGFWQVLQAIYKNELFYHRKQVLDELMARLQPDVVIIDIFSSSDFLVLYSYYPSVRLLFCNPMLSTYRVDNLPIVSEAEWPQNTAESKERTLFSARHFMKNPRAKLYQAAMRHQWRKLQQMAGLSAEHEVVDTPFTRLFTNVPELILAPLEFELLPKVRQPNQHYLGLCIQEGRTDIELDADFAYQWPAVLALKQTGKRLIYCSFGTFYTGSDRTLFDFVMNLLAAVADIPNVQLVCSVNSLVIETLKTRQNSVSNVHFFKQVPQLEVLKRADVYITHGGLGSIKESILYGVPMLVYPLDLHYDQNGNGLKVEHHGIGLRGVFNLEPTTTMHGKISRLLEDDSFRVNMNLFREKCNLMYTANRVEKTLTELLTVAM